MKLKNFFLSILALAFISSMSIFAQDEDLDNLNFDEEPIEEERPPYFALAFGYTGTFKWIPETDIQGLFDNNNLGFAGENALPGNFYNHGISAFVAVPWVTNLRLGFFTQWGNINKEYAFDTITTRGYNYHAYQIGGSVGWAWVLFDHFALVPELNLGYGTLDLDIYQTQGNVKWNQNELISGNSSTDRLRTSYFIVKPQLNIEYALTNYLIFRAAVGYDWSFNDQSNWTINRTAEIEDAPKGQVNGPYLQFGVFIGLANY